jgi:aryl-alcohol dehydrogenase-like predicted oxidoreductase
MTFYYADATDDQGFGPIRQTYTKEYLIEAAEKSLKRLRVEALDILQLHSPDAEKLERDEPWDALDTLRKQGKVRYTGLSIQSFKETAQTPIVEQHVDLLDVIQVRYNLLEREAEETLFPAAQKHGIGVIVRIPLLFGLLTGKFTRESTFTGDDHRKMNLSPEKLEEYLTRFEAHRPLYENNPRQTMAQVSLRFCITHPACHTVIPGAKTEQQAVDNAGAGEFGPLNNQELEIIEELGASGSG